MNYLLSFALCLTGTVMAVLTKNPEWYWLLVSDANVALFLLIAYGIDPNRPGNRK